MTHYFPLYRIKLYDCGNFLQKIILPILIFPISIFAIFVEKAIFVRNIAFLIFKGAMTSFGVMRKAIAC